MTDRGTRVRWTTAALIAPTAAALFAGTTAWATGHQPSTGTTAAKPVPTPTATVDPAVVALQKAVAKNTAQVAALRASVLKLKAQAAAIAGGKAKAGSSSGSSTWTTKSSSSSGSSTKKKSSTSHASSGGSTVTVTAPKPAPTTQTSTGASGAK